EFPLEPAGLLPGVEVDPALRHLGRVGAPLGAVAVYRPAVKSGLVVVEVEGLGGRDPRAGNPHLEKIGELEHSPEGRKPAVRVTIDAHPIEVEVIMPLGELPYGRDV